LLMSDMFAFKLSSVHIIRELLMNCSTVNGCDVAMPAKFCPEDLKATEIILSIQQTLNTCGLKTHLCCDNRDSEKSEIFRKYSSISSEIFFSPFCTVSCSFLQKLQVRCSIASSPFVWLLKTVESVQKRFCFCIRCGHRE
jgi:hypothetical protein